MLTKGLRVLFLALLAVNVPACSSGSSEPAPTYTVGGEVQGMQFGGSLRLKLNTGEFLTVFQDGNFTFTSKFTQGQGFGVTVQTAPANTSCTVTNGSGTMGTANITSVQVACAPALPGPFNVGVNVAGLPPGESVSFQDAGAGLNTLTYTEGTTPNPAIIHSTANNGDPYNVTVTAQPASGAVTMSANAGFIYGADITAEASYSAGMYAVGGTMTGLPMGSAAILQLNGANDLVVEADGGFLFQVALGDGAAYDVTVLEQPLGATCTITNGSGTIAGAHVLNVAADCVLSVFTVHGNLTGLPLGDSVTLQLNGAETLPPMTADGPFAFTTQIPHLGAYAVTVQAQPTGAICQIANSSGFINGADVTDVLADCPQFTVGGMLTGLPTGDLVVLQINGGDDIPLNADGAFTFPAIYDGQPYAVTILTQPTGAICFLTNDTGNLAGADVTDVTADCPTYTVGGTLAGLPAGTSVTLQNNGGDDLELFVDGAFTFGEGVYDGQPYAVTVSAQPTGAYCYLEMESGTIAGANVSDVAADIEVAAEFLLAYTSQGAAYTILRQIDSRDASSTPISHGGLGIDGVEGATRDPNTNTVWGVRNISATGTSELVSIDLNAGTATGGLVITGADHLLGAAFHAASNRLYAMDDEDDNLVTIDTVTGVATVIGSPGGGPGTSTIHALAFDVAGQLYAFDATSRRLLWLNELNGAVQASFQLNGSPDISAMVWDAVNSRLVAFNATSNTVFELVPANPQINSTVAQLGEAGTVLVGGMCDDASGRLYGITSASLSALWEFALTPPANGVWATAVGTSAKAAITGMVYDPASGVSYAIAQSSRDLVEVDIATGETIFIADLTPAIKWGALAWDENTSTLLGVENVNNGSDILYAIDPVTGAETSIHTFADITLDIGGASFDARTDTLWMVAGRPVADDVIISLDLAGGPPFAPAVQAGVVAGLTQIHGLAWDPGRNALLGTSVSNDQLLQVDPATMQVSIIGVLVAEFSALMLEP